MRREWMLVCCLGVMACLGRSTIAQEPGRSGKGSAVVTAAGAATVNSNSSHDRRSPAALTSSASGQRAARIEGEKLFRANCGRCHQPPHKFPPRVMAMAIRHMRVRAMLTDEDMTSILSYMTQ
ncbi:MAG TPA: cytochrome c [Candidatus Acidoferrum sp.]